MKTINSYFEASDNADYTLLQDALCRVRFGTVRATEEGALVYAVAPGAIGMAAEAGARAAAICSGALAVAIVSGSKADALAPGACAQAWAVGALAQAFGPGSIAQAFDDPKVFSSPPSMASKIPEDCGDLGFIIVHDFYRPDNGVLGEDGACYPWLNNYATLEAIGGFSIAMSGPQINGSGIYTGVGMHLRDAIRHAEILGDNVPPSAYEKLAGYVIKPRQELGAGARPADNSFTP